MKYDKLWKLLKSRGMVKSDLYVVVSNVTVAALAKNKNVRVSTIEDICKFLECEPNDIMEVEHDNKQHYEDGHKNRFNGTVIMTANEMIANGTIGMTDARGKLMNTKQIPGRKRDSDYEDKRDRSSRLGE